MTIAARTSHALRRWFDSLKFQIVLIAVVAGVLSALGTAKLVLNTTQADLERMLLANAAENSERTSQLLASKLEMLQVSLKAVARQVPAALWDDAPGLTRFLLDKPALGALFDSYAAIRADGQALVRIEKGTPRPELPNVADREYFRDALRTDQPVVSAPMRARIDNHPIVVMAMSVRAADGSVLGVVIGSIELESSGLFSNMNDSASARGSGAADQPGIPAGNRDLSGGHTVRGQQGGSDLHHPANRRGLCEGPHRLQLHLSWEDHDGSARSGGGSRACRERAPPHALATFWPARGHRQCRRFPGE